MSNPSATHVAKRIRQTALAYPQGYLARLDVDADGTRALIVGRK